MRAWRQRHLCSFPCLSEPQERWWPATKAASASVVCPPGHTTTPHTGASSPARFAPLTRCRCSPAEGALRVSTTVPANQPTTQHFAKERIMEGTPRRPGRTLRTAGLAFVAVAALTASACSGGGGGGALGEGGGDGKVSKLVVPVNESPWLNAYKGLVAEYTKETGVQVELRTFPYDELRTQIVNDIKSGGHTYDVYQVDEPNLHEFFANEWMKPLNKVDPGFKMDEAINSYANFSYWNPKTKTSDPNGTPMALPLNGNVHLFMYRKDLYDQLGLQPPKSWADAVANGKKAQASGKVKYGYVVRAQATLSGGAQITYDFLPLLYSHEGKWFVEEGKDWTPAVNSAEAIAAAKTFRELVALGPAATTTLGQAQVIGTMQAGDALQTHVVAAAAPQLESESDSNVAGKIGYSVLPAGPTGKIGVASGTWALGVPAGLPDERSKASLDFINWVLSKKGQTKFTELGGIPTRKDVIDGADVTPAQMAYLKPIQESWDHVDKHVRYEFSATMLPVTEKHLAAIAAGKVTPEAGMGQMQNELLQVVTKAGYPTGK